MLTDRKILGKLAQIEQRYSALRFHKVADVPAEMCETLDHFRQEPGPDTGLQWRPAPPGIRWGGDRVTAWFRGDVTLPEQCAGRKVFVEARTGGETLFLVDGEHRGVFDGNHPVVLMTMNGAAGRRYHLSLEAYAGHTFPGCMPADAGVVVTPGSATFNGIWVVLEREDVSAFVYDLGVLRRLVQCLDENSLRRNRVIRELARVYALVEMIPEESDESVWRPHLAEAREVMRPLLECRNGPTVPWFGIIGHSHIDTAWLWPLAETWRKCARTFSSALTLMEQYPEFLFIQSSPCQMEVMRREYPGIFERVRARVAEGRWEPNGGMWVEPDCNLPSGESFVRQLLFGQRSTREMFGYTADTLWLPDVFGYSAALPQILRGCYVDYFCTTKISWNDTTRFPYDTFVWRGIDGTPVIAHYNAIHCWPDPETLTAQWNWVQHKDVQDRRLSAYGFGDGGGGPMMEMVEVARRVADLEGCPRTRYMRVGDFMARVRDELKDLPEWVGELYLELHRGTLTSIAAIKRGNRKCELALRDAEFACSLAALRGAPYPTSTLQDLWKTLLTNQFHDILPGSSIAAVNDEAIASFGRCIAQAEALGDSALRTLAGPAGDGLALLVANSLSWERVGEFELRGAPEQTRPAAAGVVAQWVKDVQDTPRLVVSGLPLPALGAVILPLEPGDPGGASSFKVVGDRVETPHASIRFDPLGHIVSFVDKASGREVVSPLGALNTFLLGEDVPEAWDNWDIDSDQRLRLRAQGGVVRREVVADGPLQLRLRFTYHIGARSTITQDVVFHSTTPRVDFETVVDWAEKHRLLKVGFDLAVHTEAARHEIQYGHVRRPTHRNLPQDRARFEVCAHKWTDLSDSAFGVALLNDCKFGVGVAGNEVRLTLIKSGTHPDPRGDEGRHLFTYSLLPHATGFSVPAVVRPAYELNIAPLTVPAGPQAQDIGSLLTLDAPNVIVECVKWAEDRNALVVRLYEAGGGGGRVKVTFGVAATSVSETNLMEEQAVSLALEQGSVALALRPFEIKTLVVEL